MKKFDTENMIGQKQMWDSEKGSWVPFNLWGAHFIVNYRKEHLVLRAYRPLDAQTEFGPVIYGWQSINSSFLNDKLKEDKNDSDYENPFKSFAGYQEFREIVKLDQKNN
jgi:hypothetical protein